MKAQNWVGTTIGGRYQIEELLGQGGMSAVYRATDPNLRRAVAIKLIHPHLSTDPNFIGRFKEEAAAVARLRHPNIVQVHDFNIDDGTYYMVMEYLAGETLQARLKRLNIAQRFMRLSEAVHICNQLCDAVGYAHNHELVHRDIKPANIMLDVNGQAILMDFGIVKIIGGDYNTATGATIGTAMYMSPEQIRTERVDDRSDIYSLGVTLYEMISGQPPYKANSAMTIMMMVLNDPLPDLRNVREGIPENLLAVVNMALAKEASERFQTMEEMAARLQLAGKNLESAPPATTVVDQAEVKPATPPVLDATYKDTAPESLNIESSQPQAESARVEFNGQDEYLPESPIIHDLPTEPDPARSQSAGRPTKVTSRLGSRRFLAGVVGVLLFLVVAIGGYLYISSRSTPTINLPSVNHSSVPININTAQSVVNLATWGTDSFIEALAFSPDGVRIGTANNREEKRFSDYRFYSSLWRVDTGSLQNYQLGHSQWVYDVDFSPEGQFFGTVSDDATVILWKTNDGSMIRNIMASSGSLSSIDFSPNNLLLAAGSWNGIVDIWDMSNDNLLRTLEGNESAILDIEFSPNNQLLAAAMEDNTIQIWQVSDGSLLHTLREHQAAVRSVAFSPDGGLLASASEDHTIGLWQMNEGSLLRTMPGHSEPVLDAEFSPDGSLLASGSGDGTLRLWQVSDGKLVSIVAEDADSITSVAFSPDSHLLVSGSADGTLQFWGISEAIPLETYPVPEN
jgi:serine/threonine protein kinase